MPRADMPDWAWDEDDYEDRTADHFVDPDDPRDPDLERDAIKNGDYRDDCFYFDVKADAQ